MIALTLVYCKIKNIQIDEKNALLIMGAGIIGDILIAYGISQLLK